MWKRKREKWQQEKREREEKELNEKKARAREQTKKNERLSEERAARFHRGNHARINEDFLRRLEDKSASPVSAGGPDVRYSQELQSLQEMFPDKDPAKLKKMLELTNGDVSEVAELLM
ncbi:uncharacterized protein [Diadema antillarum]|uniref:uncharacterized protein n=1 Tax=Diadema antillarum TaxID=105358 RepID=UPI003A8B1232